MKLRFALLVIPLIFCLPLTAQTLYENGPPNWNYGAVNIAGPNGWAVADSFFLTGQESTVISFSIASAVVPGDMPIGVDWEILTGDPSWMGGTIVAQGTGAFNNVYWGQFGNYDIYTSTVTGLNVSLGSGTYWLELLNGTTGFGGNPLYWNENDGIGCQSTGCPSSAYQNQGVGSIPSEAFTVSGTNVGASVPEPGTVALFGSGIVGLAAFVRRRIGL